MIPLPDDVVRLIREIFGECNLRVATKMSRIPTVHETSLDLTFIEHFSQVAVPITLPSEWTVRLDTHYLGGGRHFGAWEVADIGLLVIFRRAGHVVRSKVALLQAKRLYPIEQDFSEDKELDYMIGFGRLYESDNQFAAVTTPRRFSFEEGCRYRTLVVDDQQYQAIRDYEKRYTIPVHYLLYHPLRVPSSTAIPLSSRRAPRGPLRVGCRVVRADLLRQALSKQAHGYVPSYGDLKYLLPTPYDEADHSPGWRLEYFVSELLSKCHEGHVTEEGLADEGLIAVFNRRTHPISAAVQITFDAPE